MSAADQVSMNNGTSLNACISGSQAGLAMVAACAKDICILHVLWLRSVAITTLQLPIISALLAAELPP